MTSGLKVVITPGLSIFGLEQECEEAPSLRSFAEDELWNGRVPPSETVWGASDQPSLCLDRQIQEMDDKRRFAFGVGHALGVFRSAPASFPLTNSVFGRLGTPRRNGESKVLHLG
jgi:hypothetical protein